MDKNFLFKKNGANRGFTILETLVSITILFMLIIIGLVYLELGTSEVSASFNKSKIIAQNITAQMDIVRSIERSTWGMFTDSAFQGIIYNTSDYRHALILQSALDTRGRLVTDPGGVPKLQKYIVYYVIRPQGDTCIPSSVPNPDNYCPHKLLIRRDISPAAAVIEDCLNNDIQSTHFGDILDTKVLAQGVLSFDVNLMPAGTRYSVKFNGSYISLNDTSLGFSIKKYREAEYGKKYKLVGDEYKRNVGSGFDLSSDTTKLFEIKGRAIPANL